jgi:hypothetical protein
MSLSSSDLESDIKLIFEAGGEADDVAVKLASAIIDYSSKAEILMLPGPMLIPVVPTPLPSTGQGAMLGVKMPPPVKASARSALELGIKGQFSAGDPTLSLMAIAIQLYVNTSFTMFQSPIGHMATGATLMAAPPILQPVVAAGLAGKDSGFCAEVMAGLIHAAFQLSIFNGAGIAIDGGLGAVVAQKLM